MAPRGNLMHPGRSRLMRSGLASFAALWALLSLPAAAEPANTPPPPVHTAHKHPVSHRRHTPARHAAVAPIPAQPPLPGTREAAFQPAPVPNRDATRPDLDKNPETKASPAILSRQVPEVGEGYVYGSSPQALDDKNTSKAPGVDVSIPVK